MVCTGDKIKLMIVGTRNLRNSKLSILMAITSNPATVKSCLVSLSTRSCHERTNCTANSGDRRIMPWGSLLNSRSVSCFFSKFLIAYPKRVSTQSVMDFFTPNCNIVCTYMEMCGGMTPWMKINVISVHLCIRIVESYKSFKTKSFD